MQDEGFEAMQQIQRVARQPCADLFLYRPWSIATWAIVDDMLVQSSVGGIAGMSFAPHAD